MKFSPPSKVDVGRARSEWGPPQLRRKFGGGIHIKHRPRFFPPPSYLFLRPSFNAINANTGRTNSNSLRSRNTDAAYLRSGPPKLVGCSKRFYGRACTFKTFACASQIVRQEEAFSPASCFNEIYLGKSVFGSLLVYRLCASPESD